MPFQTVRFGPSAARLQCPHCRADVVTETETSSGLLTWLLCLLLLIFGYEALFRCPSDEFLADVGWDAALFRSVLTTVRMCRTDAPTARHSLANTSASERFERWCDFGCDIAHHTNFFLRTIP